jgi:hypothetical protein
MAASGEATVTYHVHPTAHARLRLVVGQLLEVLDWVKARARREAASGGRPDYVVRRDSDGMAVAWIGESPAGEARQAWRRLDRENAALGGATQKPPTRTEHTWAEDERGPVCTCHGYRGFRQRGFGRVIVRLRRCRICKAPATELSADHAGFGHGSPQWTAYCARCGEAQR